MRQAVLVSRAAGTNGAPVAEPSSSAVGRPFQVYGDRITTFLDRLVKLHFDAFLSDRGENNPAVFRAEARDASFSCQRCVNELKALSLTEFFTGLLGSLVTITLPERGLRNANQSGITNETDDFVFRFPVITRRRLLTGIDAAVETARIFLDFFDVTRMALKFLSSNLLGRLYDVPC